MKDIKFRRKSIGGVIVITFILFISCNSAPKATTSLRPVEKATISIQANESINDIIGTYSMQLINNQILFNYIDTRNFQFISQNLSTKKFRKIKFYPEGPNSLGSDPSYFYLNHSNEIIVVDNDATFFTRCLGDDEMLKIKDKIILPDEVRCQFLQGIRPGLQQNDKLIFFHYSGDKFKNLITFDIEKFSVKEVNIPFQEDIFNALNSKVTLLINCISPFVTMDKETYVFSSWYSNVIYEWDGKGAYSEKKLKNINESRRPLSTFIDSWEKAILEGGYTSHCPVIKIKDRQLYITENYSGEETKKAELLNLDLNGDEISKIDVSQKGKCWVSDRLVIFKIDEENNVINFEIWK